MKKIKDKLEANIVTKQEIKLFLANVSLRIKHEKHFATIDQNIIVQAYEKAEVEIKLKLNFSEQLLKINYINEVIV